MTAPDRHPALARLDALVGEWKLQAEVDGHLVQGGRTRFEWLGDEPFLIQHVDAEPPPPDAPGEWVKNSPEPVTTIFGLDDSQEQFTMLYADARNVFRVYRTTLEGGVWNLWREAPGFSQRFTGTISDDGNTISGRWDHSQDGVSWNHDFNLTYLRVTDKDGR